MLFAQRSNGPSSWILFYRICDPRCNASWKRRAHTKRGYCKQPNHGSGHRSHRERREELPRLRCTPRPGHKTRLPSPRQASWISDCESMKYRADADGSFRADRRHASDDQAALMPRRRRRIKLPLDRTNSARTVTPHAETEGIGSGGSGPAAYICARRRTYAA